MHRCGHGCLLRALLVQLVCPTQPLLHCVRQGFTALVSSHHSDGGAALLRTLTSQDRVFGFEAQVLFVDACRGRILCLVVLRTCGDKTQESPRFLETLAAVACDHVILLSDFLHLCYERGFATGRLTSVQNWEYAVTWRPKLHEQPSQQLTTTKPHILST